MVWQTTVADAAVSLDVAPRRR